MFFADVCEQENIDRFAVTPYSLYYYCQREGSAVKAADNSQLLQFGQAWSQRLLSGGRDDIFLDKAIEWFLSIRYVSSYILPDREAVHECNARLAELRRFLRKTAIYGVIYKFAYLVFIRFPRLYWLHRVIGDPSMWKWE